MRKARLFDRDGRCVNIAFPLMLLARKVVDALDTQPRSGLSVGAEHIYLLDIGIRHHNRHRRAGISVLQRDPGKPFFSPRKAYGLSDGFAPHLDGLLVVI